MSYKNERRLLRFAGNGEGGFTRKSVVNLNELGAIALGVDHSLPALGRSSHEDRARPAYLHHLRPFLREHSFSRARSSGRLTGVRHPTHQAARNLHPRVHFPTALDVAAASERSPGDQ